MTNRDLYLGIAGLMETAPERDLEEYLRALLPLLRAHREQDGLAGPDFLSLLTEAFTALALPYDSAWETGYAAAPQGGFAEVEALLIRQIVDLRDLRNAGMLDDPQRWFGTDAPRPGPRWYNFDPKSYLECGAAGSLDGWEPGDPTGRDFVPGEVTTLGPDGELTGVDPRAVERPIHCADSLSWEAVGDFFWCGQSCE